jgi:hypothetical protein
MADVLHTWMLFWTRAVPYGMLIGTNIKKVKVNKCKKRRPIFNQSASHMALHSQK